MGAYESVGKVSKAVRGLLLHWNETKASWDDPVSRNFETRYLDPLQVDARNAATAMSEMAALMDQIRKECS